MEGWYKLHRKLLDSPLWLSEPFTRGQAWVDLIGLATHENQFFYVRGIKVNVSRGEVAWSEPKLAARWKWSRTKLRNFLKDLDKEQQIGQQKNNVTQILTIINYELYQEKEQQAGQQKNSRKTAEEQQKDVYKNEENDNNEENKKKKIFIAPKISEVTQYFTENGYTEESAGKFWQYYDTGNWTDSKGQKVKNWKQKAQAVWFKPENKIGYIGRRSSNEERESTLSYNLRRMAETEAEMIAKYGTDNE